LKNRSRADVREDGEGLLAAVNGGLELTTEPVHEAKACPRKGLAFGVADLAAHIQGVLACVQGQFELAEDGVVTTGKGQGVRLAVPASQLAVQGAGLLGVIKAVTGVAPVFRCW